MAHRLALSKIVRTALIRGMAAVCAVVCLAVVRAEAQDESVRLRLAWGGGTPTQWVGKISLSEGSLSELQLTGTEIDAPGSMWIEDGAVRIASPRPRRVDGFDITATAPLSAMLRVDLSGDAVRAAKTVEIPLEKLRREYERLPIDERGNVVLVHRAAADTLRIITDRKQLIFDSGEEFAFDLAMAIPGVEPGSSLDLKVEVIPGRSGQSTWHEDRRVPVPVDQSPRVPLAVPLPVEEGVYTIRLRVAKPAGFHERWVPGVEAKTLAERKFQVVVFDANKKLAPGTEGWRTLLEIDPAHPAWWKRLPDWVWLPAARFMPKGPLGSTPAKVIDHSQGKFVELAARKKNESAEWQAYPLPIGRPGTPHLIEVDYPSDAPQALGISLVEPNAAGRVTPPGQGGGHMLDEWSVRSDGVVRTVQYVCWPKTASPWLVVHNSSAKGVARFGKIRVKAAGNRLPAVAGESDKDSKRLIAAYIARPYLAESFDASDAAAANGQSVNDWQSYYEATTRLVDYLRYAGYNAAVIDVAAEGSAIYPSQVLQRTPRYDRSWLDAGTVDLPPIDPLELLLRVCDREGVSILPAVRMDAPLPELESLRRGDPLLDASLVCRDFRGQGWHERFSLGRPAAVRYNLLNPRVQESFAEVVQEVVDRYGEHESFAGMGVQLAGGTTATLPGPQWTIDAESVKAYLADSQAPWPANYDVADPVGRFRGLSEQDAPFRAWRAKRVSRFYGDLAEKVQSSDSSRRLVLLTEELFDDAERSPRIQPRLNGSVAWKELFREAGLDCEFFANDRRATLLRPTYFDDGREFPDAAHDGQINSASELTELAAGGVFGGLLQFQRPSLERLTSFETSSPYGAERTNLTIGATPRIAGGGIRKQLVAGLTTNEARMVVIGGFTLPRGSEEQQRPLLELLAAVPEAASANESRTASEHGVEVRTVSQADETVCLITNRSPWPVQTSVTLDFPRGGRMTSLLENPTSSAGEYYTQGQHIWTLTVPPFDAVATRCSDPQVKIVGLRTKCDEGVKTQLAAQLQDLRQRNLSDRRTYPKLVNPSFEQNGNAGAIEGWTVRADGTNGTAELDANTPHAGEKSLRIQSNGGTVVVSSMPFDNPGTGQLAMTTYVRAKGVDRTSELRIAFHSDRNGYRQYTTIPGEQLATATDSYLWLAFGVEDLPLDSRDQIQVRFELSGPGEAWIDDVVLFDLLFPHNFYAESDQQKLAILRKMHVAEAALAENRLHDSWRLMGDYWLEFAQQHLPLVEARTEVAREEPKANRANAPQPPQTPSLSDRMKEYMPGFLR